MRIEHALSWAQQELAGTESPVVDARALLSHCLGKTTSYLYTWPEREVSAAQLTDFKSLVQQRKNGTPVAYLRGYQEFWSLSLKVSPATLIPRPDTELLVEKTLEFNTSSAPSICDLGTGTGAIAIALATELPYSQVVAVDKVAEAVELAKVNVTLNRTANVIVKQSDWFAAVGNDTFDIIVSNPPYVEPTSDYLAQGDVRFEPASALTSGVDGLEDIRRIVAKASEHLNSHGMVLIEHGYNQGAAVAEIFAQHGYTEIVTFKDINALDRITLGRWHTCE
ncbi:peptide chain release factor N(5)-glutamine methyltransferase [Alteromonas ponticola]|uniref:Release factor glutamine methyltransferase n=1 Tax=Alteromonas ponticola TaxID=2720613 RepID=A0ABX1QX29_9ALTE|nr:peptide chain release factor N(5)-glutamine methyltransferase [Alteromonas ponticola]NMH58804.1 peptide chain release factor N(5)-glutamine methyltransferase [Alteromonas ponticola]